MTSGSNKRSMSKIGFILSAVGAAVGLGNLWGFPTKMMSHGGPAFLIPYIIGVLFLGLPFLILEINLGSKWRKAPATFYGNYLGRGGKAFAWFQAAIQLMIGTYYAIIISWVVISMGVALTDSLGEPGFFSKSILGTSDSATGTSLGSLGKIQPVVFLGFFGVIVVSAIVVSLGIDRGIETANKVMVPFLFVLIIGIFTYSLTLDSASRGLEAMFSPDFNKLEDLAAWRKAFGQAFFTLSLAVSIIVVYSAHSPKGGDNTNRAITIMAGDTLIAILACVIIASTLGYSLGQGIVTEGVGEDAGKFFLASDGSKLGGSAFVFKMFPQTFKSINQSVGGLGNVVGFAFFLAVLFAALSSMISLFEPTVANLEGAHNLSRPKGVLFSSGVMFIFGLPLAFQGAEPGKFMDITDGYFTTYFLLISAVITGLMVIVSGKKTRELTSLNNQTSVYKLGSWYRYLLFFSVALTLAAFALGLWTEIKDGVFGKYTTFQWVLSSLCYFIPFTFLVFGFGFSGFWSRLFRRQK